MTRVPVTVVVPHFNQPESLELVLAGLVHQTHPADQMQVVVADDGSTEGPRIPDDVPYAVLIARQEHDGFGLARARNLGAEQADGDVLIFLDADMVPERGFVEAHLAAVGHGTHVISIGHRRHVAPEGLRAAELLSKLATGGSVEHALAGRETSEPGWRADHLARTDDLRRDADEAYRIASGGNLAMHRDFYHRVGGTDPSFRQWGGEDLEFAFRATQHGAEFVYSRDALAWHLGLEARPDEDERRSQAQQRPLLANRVASPHLRSGASGRRFTVPHLKATISAGAAHAESMEILIDELLRHPLGAAVHVEGVDDEHRRLVLGRAFSSDPRVTVGDRPVRDRLHSPAPVQANLRADATPSAEQVFAAVERLLGPPTVGVVRLGDAGTVHRQQYGARLAHANSAADEDLLHRIAVTYGEVELQAGASPTGRVPAAAVDDGDVLRELWWSLTPSQRRLVERTARAGGRLMSGWRRRSRGR